MLSPPLRLPTPYDRQEDTYYAFVNLKNKIERVYFKVLLVSGEQGEQNCWNDRGGSVGNRERLYRFAENRWVLLVSDFLGRPVMRNAPSNLFGLQPPVNRELCPLVAARWLRTNDHSIPSALSFADWRGCFGWPFSHIRLDRHWMPSVLHAGNNVSTVNGSETSESLQEHETDQNEALPPLIPVILSGPDDEPIVYGVRKKRLTWARYDTIKALLDAKRNLSKKELDKKSGHKDARKFLKKMAAKDEDWARAIIMPEGPCTGYGIRRI